MDYYLFVASIRAWLSSVMSIRNNRKMYLNIQRMSLDWVATHHLEQLGRTKGSGDVNS